MKIRNIAHRGLWDAAVPQNTLDAFRRAWAAGATWIETDFHHTIAGQMVCVHAEGELRAYTGCEKPIAELTPDEVASLRLDPARAIESGLSVPPAMPCDQAPCDGPFRIPFLDEVLATVPPYGTVQAEIKGYSPQYADMFDAAVRAAGLSEGNVVVSSFNFEALADFHARKPSYRTLWLVGMSRSSEHDIPAMVARCAAAGFGAFCPGMTVHDRPFTPDEADLVRAAGLSFRVYGVNSPEALKTAASIGAEAFTCNYWRQAFDWAREIDGLELLP